MLAKVFSCALSGLEGRIVRVEVDIARGLPHTTIVGLPDAAVRESKDRLFAALRNAKFEYPEARITVNLAPADVRKAGPAYDLAIALGILVASRQIEAELGDTVVVGEVSLDGSLRFTQGVLPIAAATRMHGMHRVIVPQCNAGEAALVPGLTVLGAASLPQLVDHLSGRSVLEPVESPALRPYANRNGLDLAHVRGQGSAKRALEIAAAGGHNILLSGPPGAGKTMLARCLPSILPPLTFEEALEVTAIYSVSGTLPPDTSLVNHRPFRSPHHSISQAGLVGGGSWPRPGEISLAHNGVLFLDELPEFGRQVLEVLRQPLEDRVVRISRAAGQASYPAAFALAAARNPCPCGHFGDEGHTCSCSLTAIDRYTRRISGPLLDRIDIHIDVPRVEDGALLNNRLGEPSSAVRKRVERARDLQTARLGLKRKSGRPAPTRAQAAYEFSSATRHAACNGEMSAQDVRRYCKTAGNASVVLHDAIRRNCLSARSVHRILKLARTIADLGGRYRIEIDHVLEALQYRVREAS